VVPNGVDVAQFEQASPDPYLRRKWDLDGKFVLLVLSQLIPSKRQDLAIEALASLRGRGMNASLILVGGEVLTSRGERARLEGLAKRLGVANDCIFAGFRRDVPNLLKLADLLIHPGREESFGRALIEAMASGLPVIAAGGGGVEEVVEDGVTSVIVRSASPEVWVEAIEKLHRDPSLRQRMGTAGRKRVKEHFTIESHVAGVEQIYEEVLSSSR
jgi:glycosyltransferase involved in cell wall biosynthesis